MLLIFMLIGGVCASIFVVSVMLGHDGGDVSFDHDHDGMFSIQSFLLFGVGFGGIGTLATALGSPATIASAAGMLSGLVGVLASQKITKLLKSHEGDSTVSADDLRGRTGRVATTIPEGGMGEVSVTDRMGRINHRRATGLGRIPEGALVTIVEVHGDIVHVTRSA